MANLSTKMRQNIVNNSVNFTFDNVRKMLVKGYISRIFLTIN
jgi:hypothetical protein